MPRKRLGALAALGELLGTDFTRCAMCSLEQRPLQNGEERLGFDLEPFSESAQKALFVFVVTLIVGAEASCIHGPRMWIRCTAMSRIDVGGQLRLKATEYSLLGVSSMGKRFSLLADMLLNEGAFHPDHLRPLTDEELSRL